MVLCLRQHLNTPLGEVNTIWRKKSTTVFLGKCSKLVAFSLSHGRSENFVLGMYAPRSLRRRSRATSFREVLKLNEGANWQWSKCASTP